MKRSSEEDLIPSKYTFSLRAVSQSVIPFDVEHSFEPLMCKKTFKLISVIPSYRSQGIISFQTDADLPSSSLKIEQEEVVHSPVILTPKPTAHFCQVCKEKFEDYLKHISHPFHLQKSKEIENDLDFNLLKELLNNSNSKKRKVTTKHITFQDQNLTPEKSSIKCQEEHTLEETFLFGSKKRIVVNQDGDPEAVSLSGSTKVIQEEGYMGARRSQRQCSLAKENQF